jgi:ankyrin repeat protein
MKKRISIFLSLSATISLVLLAAIAQAAAAQNSLQRDVPNPDGFTPLVSASISGDIEAIHHLIDNGADINGCDARGNFPLYAAVIADRPEIVEFLIKHGANINQAKAADVFPLNERNNTALHAACIVGSQKSVELLINAGADANAFANIMEDTAQKLKNVDWKLLAKALKPEDLDKLRKTQNLLQMGCGFTPLTLAAQYDRTNIASFLLEHGADVNFQKPYNVTALIQAAITGKRDFIEFLRNWKANPNLKGPFGNALAYALLHEQYDSAKSLMADGVSLEFATNDLLPGQELQDFTRGVYQTMIADNLAAESRNADAKNEYAEAVALLSKAREELNIRVNIITSETDKADKKARRLAFWATVAGAACDALSQEAISLAQSQSQRQMAQITALKNSKKPGEYFANFQKIEHENRIFSPTTLDNGQMELSSAASGLVDTRQEKSKARTQIYLRKAETCDYLIERITNILRGEAEK